MGAVRVRLPDGSEEEFEADLTLAQVAAKLSRLLSRLALAAEVEGRAVDLGRTLGEVVAEAAGAAAPEGAPAGGGPGAGAWAPTLRFLTFEDEAGRAVMRHSAAHVLAQAVKRLHPEARLGIGPAIVDGFYYDFDVPQPFQPEDLIRIEAEMRNIIGESPAFERLVVSREEALELFRSRGEPYKLELIGELAPDQPITCYRQGDFIDLCAGPHLPSAGRIRAFKLLSAAGAYWRGDEHRPMLQRIYGTAFESQEDLEQHLARVEEAARRDHRRLGRELDLFSVHNEVGPGLVHWHPRGGAVRSLAEDFWRRQHRAHGYELVYSPHLGKAQLWETSGHLGFYRENMYAPMMIEGQEYFIKPMNCPFHIMIYKERQRSYRDLPLRFAELGTVYRYERSGVLHGLLRVRGFTQDDAHIFCRPDQIESEIRSCLDFTLYLWRSFGFEEFFFMLSTR
ncbi:MAG: threonine--tRNA ligase, partial [Acetobacteraceae bacterium]|nr:threonine--tRNA ligase [Acetobacteraceae bacterium]